MKHYDPSLLTAGIPVAAMRAEPLSTAEIDAHPDSARIWATVEGLRGEYQRGYDEGYEAGEDEAGEPEGDGDYDHDDAIEDVESRIHALLRKYEGDLSDKLAADILALTEGL